MFLLPVPASPMVCQLSSMTQSALRRRKNPGVAAASGCGITPPRNLREHVEAVLEPPVGPRLHDAEEVRLPHAFDHVVTDAAISFGLLRALARKRGDGAGARQEIGHSGIGDRRPCSTD